MEANTERRYCHRPLVLPPPPQPPFSLSLSISWPTFSSPSPFPEIYGATKVSEINRRVQSFFFCLLQRGGEGTWKTRAKRRKCDWKSHVRRRFFFLHVQCSIRHKKKKSNLVDFPHFLWDISGCARVCMNAQMESGRRRRQKNTALRYKRIWNVFSRGNRPLGNP